jgi:hypothetical protein
MLAGFFSGCKTDPPTDGGASGGPGNGFIVVHSDIDGSKIFLDGVFTGKFTPDTIAAAAGSHQIRVEAAGEQPVQKMVTVTKATYHSVQMIFTNRAVLVEDFANVSCTPCATSNKILYSLEHYSYSRKQLVAVKYPTNFPSPTDLFYLAAKPYSNARITYYTVLTAPSMYLNGTVKPTPTDSMKVKEAIESQLTLKAQFRITVSAAVNAGNYNSQITVKCLDTAGIDFSALRLQTAVIETPIEFATPPGSNGETKFYNVLRQMIPDYNGEPLGTMTVGQLKTFTRSVPVNAVWNPANIYTVAFVQNPVTKTVYQAASSQ